MKYLVSIIAVGLMTCLAACSSDNAPDTPELPDPNEPDEVEIALAQGDSWEAAEALPTPRVAFEAIPLTDTERSMLSAQNDLALDLYRNLSASTPTNTLLSPVSLSLDLGMLANGAGGRTFADLASITGLAEGQTPADLNLLNRKLIEGLVSADKTSRISLANSIWVQNGIEIASDFVEKNRSDYYASIYRRDLSTLSAMDEINSWVADNTNGMIPGMLSQPLGDDVRLTLANALYFLGTWVKAFDRELTSKEKFTCLDGTVSEVDMMTWSWPIVTYSKGENFRAIYLPFGNGAYEMTFILPYMGVNISESRDLLTAAELTRLSEARKKKGTGLYIPRFEVEGDVSLGATLREMGYGNMFSASEADFTPATPKGGLYVSDIRQKAVIKVDEEGAEGSATTLVNAYGASGPYPDDEPMKFDRPFIFMVYETSTGAILFIGDVKKL